MKTNLILGVSRAQSEAKSYSVCPTCIFNTEVVRRPSILRRQIFMVAGVWVTLSGNLSNMIQIQITNCLSWCLEIQLLLVPLRKYNSTRKQWKSNVLYAVTLSQLQVRQYHEHQCHLLKDYIFILSYKLKTCQIIGEKSRQNMDQNRSYFQTNTNIQLVN